MIGRPGITNRHASNQNASNNFRLSQNKRPDYKVVYIKYTKKYQRFGTQNPNGAAQEKIEEESYTKATQEEVEETLDATVSSKRKEEEDEEEGEEGGLTSAAYPSKKKH